MTATGELLAAIEKLEASKPSLTACSAFNRAAVRHVARNFDTKCGCGREDGDCNWNRFTTAPAFDMLIHTVDAQLAILKLELEICNEGCSPAPQFLALARAINGAEVSA